ncbi:T9SS type A sorting domain-containing protein [Winogradskyella sp. PAMC22761]|nr:T9SS type A sorting domain-containing protein [Winogradskyella sp. PAMC22761]
MEIIKYKKTASSKLNTRLKLALVFSFSLVLNLTFSQAPANDDFINAIDVTTIINSCSADANYTIIGATPDKNEGSNWNNNGPKNNVWFKFTAPATGEINITVDRGDSKGTQRRTQLALWHTDGITEIQSERYAYDNEDVTMGAVNLTPGIIYYISVDTQSTGYSGTFTLCLQDTVDYDFYEGAIDVTNIINNCSADAIYTIIGATPDKNEGSNWNTNGPKNNVWFKFTAPVTGEINITVDRGDSKGTQRRTQLALWETDGTTEIQSERYAYDDEDVIMGAVNLTPGQIYYISVDTQSSGFSGTFTLCLQDTVDYDFYEGAIDVTNIINSCSSDETYTTIGATPDKTKGSNWNNDGPKHNRWFKFTAPATGGINITADRGDSKGTLRRTQLALWQEDGTTEIQSERYAYDDEDVIMGAVNLTPGNTYYISVDTQSSGYSGTFTLCLQDTVDYDFYEGAIDITNIINSCSTDAIYTTMGATPDKDKGSNWNNSGPKYNRWFKFTAPATGEINITVDRGDSKGTQRLTQLALWLADGITEVQSERYAYYDEDVIIGGVNLTPGNTYYISIDTYSSNYRGTFTLCLQDTVDYDFYEGAIDVTNIINSCSSDAIYTTIGATPDKSEGSNWNNDGPKYNRWFKFTAPATGEINITVDRGDSKGTQRLTQLALWKANGTTEVQSERYAFSDEDVTIGGVNLISGNTYYISVDAYSSAYIGTFTLCLQDTVDYDFYEGAIDVTNIINGCSADAIYTTIGATPDKDIASNWNNNGPKYNRWFKFTAPATGEINITVDRGDSKGTQRYTQLALWEANGTTEVNSESYVFNDDDVILGAPNLTPGNTYYISVDTYNSNFIGTFTLCLEDTVDYDFYEGAIDVTNIINSCSADAIYTTIGATPDKYEGSNWSNNGPKYNRWFKFTAPATGEINITVDIDNFKGTQQLTQLALWQADGITEVQSERYSFSDEDVIIGGVNLTPGNTYYISVDTHATYYRGTFTLCLEDTVDYDFYEGAIDVTNIINSCSADAIYTTVGATPDRIKGSNWSNNGPKYNRWFKFTAPATSEINITVDRGDSKGTQQLTQIAIWEEGGFTEVQSESYAFGDEDVTIGAVGLTPGNTYYISVDTHASSFIGTFTLCLEDTVDYDFYEGAIDVTNIINSCSADAIYTTQGATPDRFKGSNWSNNGPIANRWFKFTAPAIGNISITVDIGDSKGTQQYTQLALWQSDGETEIQSKRYTSANEHLTVEAVNLTPGTTYYISVDVLNYQQGTFTLCIENTVGYDFYEGAIDVTNMINSCSPDAIYTTTNATPDGNKGDNWNNTSPQNNRWFKFTAPATGEISITIDRGESKGTQRYTQLALWQADGVTEVQSGRYANYNDDVTIGVLNLIPGATYYISVDTRATYYSGTFTLCLEDIYGLSNYGPGGVRQDLRLWLRADIGTQTNTDGVAINSWIDQGKASDASSTTGQNPIYKNNSNDNLNYNPVLDFSGNKSMLGKYSTGFFSQDIFVVVIPNASASNTTPKMTVLSGETSSESINDISGIGFGNYTGAISNEILTYAQGDDSSYRVSEVSASKTYSNIGIINARNNSFGNGMELFYNALQIDNTSSGTGLNNITGGQYWLGKNKSDTSGSFNGRIAEIITYSSLQSDSERAKIESYLALKYGITLGVNGTSQNYVDSNNDIIWDTTANLNYNFDIAGIGKDDALASSLLNQKQSKSVNLNTDVTIGLGTIESTNSANSSVFSANRSFLIWGNDNGVLNNPGASADRVIDLGSGIQTNLRLTGKKWKIVETGGDVSDVLLSIPSASLSSFSLNSDEEYILVVSATDTFENTDIIDVIPLKVSGENLQTWYDFDGTNYFTFAKSNLIENSFQIQNTSGDYSVSNTKINLNSSFTISSWIRNGNTSGNRSFVAKGTAYDLKLNSSNRIQVSWNDAIRVTSNTRITDGKWHHIAVTFNEGNATLLIDGVIDRTVNSLPVPVATNHKFSIGAVYNNKNSISDYFVGDIDEVLVWNRALTVNQIRYIMNQEIEKFTDNTVNGKILPHSISKNEIQVIPWNELNAYFDLNSISGASFIGKSDNKNHLRIKYKNTNKTTLAIQTAPLPYQSSSNNSWSNNSTWSNGTLQTLPNSLSIVDNTSIDWNIVETNHDIDTEGNKTILGLLVNSGQLNATMDSKIEVSHYLKLNGKIDLVGKSQLVQTLGSDIDATSSGSLERDQQGTKNLYNYNYWSSPVGTTNATTNNNTYTVETVLRDGTNPASPGAINWIGGYDGASGTPISLARYWIYKFQNLNDNYANWEQIHETGDLNPANGFTLKGSGTISTDQNYTFIGKPFNGSIDVPIAANYLNLSGNPYASALDANAFILDNLSTMDGTLYFWEHSSTNSSHNISDYEGGYSTRNLTGGVGPVVSNGTGGLGTSSRIPNRFIPVGQGFFINGNTTGGNVNFNNNQRAFIKEDNSQSGTLFRQNDIVNNQEDEFTDDNYTKIRLGFNTSNNFHRQLLLGFMNEHATNGIDAGYDALLFDDFTNDMYFTIDDSKFVIQGDGYFNTDNIYPIEVISEEEGIAKFTLDDTEYFDENQPIYVYDNQTGLYHNIKETPLEIMLPAGTVENRFSLRFSAESLGIDEAEINSALTIFFNNSNDNITLTNIKLGTTVTSVSLINILGQSIHTWELNSHELEISIPVKHVSLGVYIVEVKTTNTTFSQKVIIK